jgi:D-amino-acid oxidase
MLAESGRRIRVVTRDPPLATTSCAAGALWGPYLFSDERVPGWSEVTRQELTDLAKQGEHTGVRVLLGLEAARVQVPVPAWAQHLAGYRRATGPELPAGFRLGWWYHAPLVDMPAYLGYLVERLRWSRVQVELIGVPSLDRALELAPIAVNCTGLGAAALTGDRSVQPVRGQLVVVRNPGIDWFFAEHDESPAPTYFLPHGDRLVLGGSIEADRHDLRPDRDIATAILERCATIAPELRHAEVIEDRVGLRPHRPTVRLEYERVDRGHVIHNYGHGGAGVTVSWGCARDVMRLVHQVDNQT